MRFHSCSPDVDGNGQTLGERLVGADVPVGTGFLQVVDTAVFDHLPEKKRLPHRIGTVAVKDQPAVRPNRLAHGLDFRGVPFKVRDILRVTKPSADLNFTGGYARFPDERRHTCRFRCGVCRPVHAGGVKGDLVAVTPAQQPVDRLIQVLACISRSASSTPLQDIAKAVHSAYN